MKSLLPGLALGLLCSLPAWASDALTGADGAEFRIHASRYERENFIGRVEPLQESKGGHSRYAQNHYRVRYQSWDAGGAGTSFTAIVSYNGWEPLAVEAGETRLNPEGRFETRFDHALFFESPLATRWSALGSRERSLSPALDSARLQAERFEVALPASFSTPWGYEEHERTLVIEAYCPAAQCYEITVEYWDAEQLPWQYASGESRSLRGVDPRQSGSYARIASLQGSGGQRSIWFADLDLAPESVWMLDLLSSGGLR